MFSIWTSKVPFLLALCTLYTMDEYGIRWIRAFDSHHKVEQTSQNLIPPPPCLDLLTGKAGLLLAESWSRSLLDLQYFSHTNFELPGLTIVEWKGFGRPSCSTLEAGRWLRVHVFDLEQKDSCSLSCRVNEPNYIWNSRRDEVRPIQNDHW
jgi:hypothetical protein